MQVSSQPLASAAKKAIDQQLWTVLADLKHPRDVETFAKSFLTETELTVLSKRLAILRELETGASYEDIREKLKVSSATISNIAEQRSEQGLKLALSIISRDENLDSSLKKWFGWAFRFLKIKA